MANKFNMGREFSKQIGQPCAYCRREMSVTVPGLMPTRDHVHPRSKGGRLIKWACDDCNHMKDDLTELEWVAFMRENPEWWELRRHRRRRRTYVHAAPVAEINQPLPMADTLYILRFGTKEYRRMKGQQFF